jgi:hypothetical protein
MASSPPILPTLPISVLKRSHSKFLAAGSASDCDILVPKQFASYDHVLRSNQQLVIEREAVFNVKEATIVGIVGFGGTGRICVVVNLPPTELMLLTSVYAHPAFSLLRQAGLVVSGVFFPPARAFSEVHHDARNIRLVEDGYDAFLSSDVLQQWESKQVCA